MALDIIARGMAADSIKCVSQDLTEEQKAIARNNIGVSGGSEDLKNAVQVIPQNFTDAQKQQARDNIGAVSVSSFDAAEADIADLFTETAALGQKTPSASQGSFIINEMTRSNSLSIDRATGGWGFNVIPSGGVSEASGKWSVSNEITFEKGTISTPGEYSFMTSSQGAAYLKLIPGKSYVMYIKYISGTIPANLENWAFTFSSGGKTVSMNLNNSLPVEVFVPVAGDLAFGGRFTPNGVADPSITFDEVNKYTVQILMVEVNNGSNQGAIVHNNDLNSIENQIRDMASWAEGAAPRLDSLEDNAVQVNSQTFTEEQKTQARTNIGAASQTEMSTAADNINTLNTTVDALEQVALTANQKALVVNEYNKQLNLFKNKKLPTTYEGVTLTPIGLSSYKITGTNTASTNWGFNNLADVSDLDPNKTYTLKLTVVSGTGECGIQGSTTAKQVTKTGASLSNIYITIPGSQAFSDYVVTMMLVEGSTAADYIPYYGDIIHQAEIDNSVVKYSSSQSLTDEQKAQARINIGAASQTSLDNDIANCVQIKAQSLTNAQKEQARTNIGALSSANLSVWSQRTTFEPDLNRLADVGNGKAYISSYGTSTGNIPAANAFGNVISLRNSGGELTQFVMDVRTGKVYYRSAVLTTDFGTWKEVDLIVQKGDNYIVYTSGLKIQWGEAAFNEDLAAGAVITSTIRLPIAMTTTSYKVLTMCTHSAVNFGIEDRGTGLFKLFIRNLGSIVAAASINSYSWVVIGY